MGSRIWYFHGPDITQFAPGLFGLVEEEPEDCI